MELYLKEQLTDRDVTFLVPIHMSKVEVLKCWEEVADCCCWIALSIVEVSQTKWWRVQENLDTRFIIPEHSYL